VALPKIGFNEGSLLRRIALHVGTFLLGSMAFIAIVSFVLVSIAKGLVAPRAEVAEADVEPAASGSPAAPPARVAKPPAVKAPRGKRGAAALPKPGADD
jgi:hypothetical protein